MIEEDQDEQEAFVRAVRLLLAFANEAFLTSRDEVGVVALASAKAFIASPAGAEHA